jgi:hypothetical protein
MPSTLAIALIASGAALLSAVITSALSIIITRMQIRSAGRLARDAFNAERQAQAYVLVCEQVTRVQA